MRFYLCRERDEVFEKHDSLVAKEIVKKTDEIDCISTLTYAILPSSTYQANTQSIIV